ncbi:hypothetical protein FB565_000015 [Actinoplanes lutulentus]|uniref:Uncharacterized protein n=1 Tax=Actinoplanes lutulentus TaxID=1287878 RepID=A0A327Z2G7_9ACTN|nr:hypothetical protein [Actinoplanes lutulentus]MBB2940311.1 hypothetical protein [Actinoplanes lutulentus]RAK28804.1 hypothetical protein B0I29_119142 [Actinoplanes lutulentus]
MTFLFPTTSPATVDALDARWMHEPLVYLAVAAICLLIALRFLKQALAPIGALIQAVAAAAVVAFTAVIALAMLVLAAVTTAH